MYYITEDFKQLIRNLGGEWNDQKKRPIVCLMQSTEHPDLYWAIPVGKVNHRDDKAMERIKSFMNKPTRDLRCCYYHIGRTTNKSIFFISDAIPITYFRRTSWFRQQTSHNKKSPFITRTAL